MTQQELFTDPQFLALTEQQQAFVRALVQNGNNPVEAARATYTCTNTETAKANARRNLRHVIIRRLVDKYFEVRPEDRAPTRAEFAQFLWERATGAADPSMQTKLLEMYGKTRGYFTDPPPESPRTSTTLSEPVDDDLMAEIRGRLDDGPTSSEDVSAG